MEYRPKFRTALLRDWSREVDAYFIETKQSKFAPVGMYGKAALLAGMWLGCYVWMLYGGGWPYWVGLGLATSSFGICTLHDAAHGSFSAHPRLNSLLGIIGQEAHGLATHFWKWKHNVRHHTYTNILGYDEDIDAGGLLRLHPAQPLRWWHRYQWLYSWPLMGGMTWQWCLDDVQKLFSKTSREQTRMTGRDAVGILGGKALFVTVWGIIPWKFHCLGGAVTAYSVAGFVTAVIFQLAHIGRQMSVPDGQPSCFLLHQIQTTQDFRTPIVSYLIGGLDHQTVHHLSPGIAHAHYPALTVRLEAFCAKHNLPYRNRSLWKALVEYHTELVALGRPAPVT